MSGKNECDPSNHFRYILRDVWKDGSTVLDFPNVVYCLNVSQLKCATAAYGSFFNMNVKTYCADQCPIECSNTKYMLSVSSTDYPSPSYYQKLIKQPALQARFKYNTSAMTFEAVKASVLSLYVNYGELSYTQIETSPKMNLLDLIRYV